ncbi:uncharacterized protein LOC125592008 [Brassica napus]|uniref:uncharacterized protein LOC125592008 n=1 Tax=Brassica napus TaxID=3708 RepID=UPI00207A6190|nr:uncharacterized protein LOC125592008 [Brassica napus]
MGDDDSSQGYDKGLEMKKDIRCLTLSSTNYTVWSMRMKVMLLLYDVWDTIDPGSDDAKKNNMAIALIFQSVPEALILQIGEHDTSKKIWEAIKSRNLGDDRVREARLQTLMSKFDKLKMTNTDTVDDYAGKLSGLASRAAALGEIMEASKMVKKFLKGLPRTKFIHIVASLEQVLDLNSTGFEYIVGRLKAFEERIKEETQDEDQSKLMFVKDDTQVSGSHNNSRGRGRGRGYGGRVRRRGRSNGSDGHNKGGDKTKKDYFKVKCWRCDKMGHSVSHCPTRPREEGSITFSGKTGERKALKDIYYIPSLKHNIISLGQATEMDCEINMKEDLLMLKDPCGRLLVQVTRQPNRLYKTPMEVEYPKCLQIQETDVTWIWHARLGHVNFGVMKNMVDKEMVVGMSQVIHEKDVCNACLVGKQTRKSFPPKAKYRASHALVGTW